VGRLSTASLFLMHAVYCTEAVCGFRLETAPGSGYELVDVDDGAVVPSKEAGM
jgi:hypothetical protein